MLLTLPLPDHASAKLHWKTVAETRQCSLKWYGILKRCRRRHYHNNYFNSCFPDELQLAGSPLAFFPN